VNESSPSRRQGKRRPRLSAEAITRAAIRLADAEGLDAVSIRRVAAELDARPMSLYDHFSSKDDLLARMAEEVVAGVLLEEPMPAEWRDALGGIARRLYAILVGHPWLVFVLPKRRRFGANDAKQAEQLAQAMASLKLEPAEVWTLVGTVNDYVLGHSMRVVTAPGGVDLEDEIPGSDPVEAPELAALPEWLRTRSSVERFESGLRIVLDGIESGLTGSGA
jgi:AcrR family transcriptional regulator